MLKKILLLNFLFFSAFSAWAGGAGGGGGGDKPGRLFWVAEERAWISPDELARQAKELRAQKSRILNYQGCYTTYASFEKASQNCPIGSIPVSVISLSGASGYTCQCAVDTNNN